MSTPMTLRIAITRHLETLDAVTVPVKGGRQIPDNPGALALSESTWILHSCMVEAERRLLAVYGKQLHPADSLDGPFDTISESEVTCQIAAYGKAGIPAVLIAALLRATQVTAFSNAAHLELQTDKPGGPHPRYRAGEVIAQKDIDLILSVARLINLDEVRSHADVFIEPQGYVMVVTLFDGSLSNESTTKAFDIPEYESKSGLWCTNREAAAKEGLETETLAKYRKADDVQFLAKDESCGIDRDGRVWRQIGTASAHPKYLISSLQSSRLTID